MYQMGDTEMNVKSAIFLKRGHVVVDRYGGLKNVGKLIDISVNGQKAYVRWHKGYASWIEIDNLMVVE